LRVAYGNAYAAPSAPQGDARFEQATGLVSGNFIDRGAQLYAARSAMGAVDLALVEGHSGRQLLAPYYFPDPTATDMSSFLSLDLLAMAPGSFTSTGAGFAVITHDPNAKDTSQATQLWLLPGATDASSSSAPPSALTVPACNACVMVAAKLDAK